MRHDDDGVVAAAWTALAPLLLWALHFGVAYAAFGVACTRSGGAPPAPWLQPALLGVTAVAAAALVWIAWRAVRRAAGERTLVATVRAGGAAVALAGVGWTLPALLLLPACPIATGS